MAGVVRSVAQVGVYALGNALGGPIGGAVASTVFGLLFPAGQQQLPSTRISDLQREGAEIGAPIKKFYGRIGELKSDVVDSGIDSKGVPLLIKEEKKTSTKGGLFGIGGTKVTEYKYNTNAATHLLGEGPLEVMSIAWEDGAGKTVLFDRENTAKPGINFTPQYVNGVLVAEFATDWHLYRGTELQGVDPVLAGVHGDKACPYRGCAYVVINNKRVSGGSYTVTFEVRSPITGKREIIRQRMVESGVPPERIKLQSITGDVVGCAIAQVEAARDLIEKVAATEFHDLFFLDGSFQDASRLNPATFVLGASELGAYAISDGQTSEAPPKLSWSLKSAQELPTVLRINFLDVDNNYEQGEAVAVRYVAGHENEQSLDYPFAAHLPDMVHLADVMMDELWAAQAGEKVSLLPRRLPVAPGNLLIYDAFDGLGPRALRVTKQGDLGATGLVECEGVFYDPGAYGIYRQFTVEPTPRPTTQIYSAPSYALLDIPSLAPNFRENPTLLLACGAGTGGLWGGAMLLSAARTAWGNVEVEGECLLGTLLQNYSFSRANCGRFNAEHTLRVRFDDYAPLTGEESDVADGANMLAVGNVLLSFVQATPVTGQPGVFDLSNVWPGRFGTESNGSLTLATGTKVVALTDALGTNIAPLTPLPVSLSRVGLAHAFEIVCIEDDAETTGDQSITPVGRSARPVAVSDAATVTDGAGGLYLQFSPRTRDWPSARAAWDTGRKPRETDPRRFTIALRNDASAEVWRQTISFASSDALPLQVHFTTAQLTTLFGSVPMALHGSIWQEGATLQGLERTF